MFVVGCWLVALNCGFVGCALFDFVRVVFVWCGLRDVDLA